MPKLNVLVSGSTGYIGIQLVKLLVKHKYVKIKKKLSFRELEASSSFSSTRFFSFNCP